jgi:hypothetical protein
MLITGMLIVAIAGTAAPGPSGTWIGQDGRDRVGPSSEVGPSDVQDVHIGLSGLPPARTIVQATITAEGGGAWQFRGKGGSWAAVIERAPRSSRADLYLEPAQVESGRTFTINLRYDDGSAAQVAVRGGRAAPDLRMPAAALGVAWMGQEPRDWTGSEPGVGPDGLQDARLALSRLSARIEVKAVLVEAGSGRRWRFGVNAEGDPSAELVRDPNDPARADLYFQPADDLSSQMLTLAVLYASGKTDRATARAGPIDPSRRMPAVRLPQPIAHAMIARWLGQDRAEGTHPGEVHVALTGIPTGRTVAVAALSDAVRGSWVYRDKQKQSDPAAIDEVPLVLRQGAVPGRADLFFAPVRDESGTKLTLRLVFSDGALAIVDFPGGPCDVRQRVPATTGAAIQARPGDDLYDLVSRHRTVQLTPGTYRLGRPLVLNEPVTLQGAPGATLLFAQGADQPPWPAAITVHRSRTTLEGFAVRFAGPVRWKTDVPWGPAVIGMTESGDNSHPDPRIGLRFTNLDLEAPPAANPGGWEDAPRLLRVVNARSGRVAGNRLRGGMIELGEGPWEIVENTYQGTPPGTVSPAVIAAHDGFDLIVRKNRARPAGPSGKTWRFLVLTGSGANDRIEENEVVGIGPRDDDSIPWANAPEIVLTESYRLFFEGKPAAIAADGRIISIGQGKPHGPPPRTGSVVAVLAGAHPGQWRRITQVLDPVTFLLEEPLPPGTGRIAISTGFVAETFARNTIDTRGGARAINLVLPGNHFGTRVLDNHLLGAGDAFQIMAYPTEAPGIWGWSHVPFLDGLIAGNTIEDAPGGGIFGVMHSEYTKSSRGRTYMTATVRENTVKWTPAFLAGRRRQSTGDVPPGLTIGFKPVLDPGELILTTRNNRLDAPAGTTGAATVRVHAAILNGQKTVDQSFTLAPVAGPP